jgi:hypothetical protein
MSLYDLTGDDVDYFTLTLQTEWPEFEAALRALSLNTGDPAARASVTNLRDAVLKDLTYAQAERDGSFGDPANLLDDPRLSTLPFTEALYDTWARRLAVFRAYPLLDRPNRFAAAAVSVMSEAPDALRLYRD